MKQIPLCIVCFILIFPFPLSGLTATETIRIEFGNAKNQVGIDRGEGEHWKPLFFDVDESGAIHIPDFYKGRIVIFNRKGGLLKEKPCPAGISPRMNYFTLAPKGRYVTYDNYSLHVINENGKVSWSGLTGYGVIPRFIWANEQAIFLVIPGTDQRAFIFDYASEQPLGRFGFMDGDRGIPMIFTEQEKEFTLDLNRMKSIPGTTYSPGAFDTDTDASLVFVDKQNNSLWKARKETIEYYYLYSEKGVLMKKGVISFPDTSVAGTGFWTICDNDLSIYKNYFYENHMEIVVYNFEE